LLFADRLVCPFVMVQISCPTIVVIARPKNVGAMLEPDRHSACSDES
jgi:hypothetical protein